MKKLFQIAVVLAIVGVALASAAPVFAQCTIGTTCTTGTTGTTYGNNVACRRTRVESSGQNALAIGGGGQGSTNNAPGGSVIVVCQLDDTGDFDFGGNLIHAVTVKVLEGGEDNILVPVMVCFPAVGVEPPVLIFYQTSQGGDWTAVGANIILDANGNIALYCTPGLPGNFALVSY